MKKYMLIPFLIILIGGITGCKQVFLGTPPENTPLSNYDVFTQDFRDKYGMFRVKSFDWDELTARYRKPLEANPTEAELYRVLVILLDSLDDGHTVLYDPTETYPAFEGGEYGRRDRADYEDFDFQTVQSSYVSLQDSLEDFAYHGMIGEDIGYIYLPEIYDVPDVFDSYLPAVLAGFAQTKGLIIDIRDNDGGEDESSRRIASYFTDQERPYMRAQYRIGPGLEDFEPWREWSIAPVTDAPYLKPIILLTNRYSVSAGETFSLAMKTLPQVTQMGDTTSGAFSDAVQRQLPNGWYYSMSVGDYRDQDGVSYESIGLAPDVQIVNSPEDLAAGKDRMLEAAIEALK